MLGLGAAGDAQAVIRVRSDRGGAPCLRDRRPYGPIRRLGFIPIREGQPGPRPRHRVCMWHCVERGSRENDGVFDLHRSVPVRFFRVRPSAGEHLAALAAGTSEPWQGGEHPPGHDSLTSAPLRNKAIADRGR